MSATAPATAFAPPPGEQTNLVDPVSLAGRTIAACTATMVLSTSIMALRLYARRVVAKVAGLDDVFIVAAWVSGMVMSLIMVIEVKHGSGRHLWDVTVPDFESFLKLQMVAGTCYICATCFVKISICFLYLRLSPSATFRRFVIAAMLFTMANSTEAILVFYFSCNPVSASWDLAVAADPATKCINRPTQYLAQAGINIFTDFAIFLLPMSTIWHLQLPLRQRVGVIAIFAAGFFVCIVSIIRIRAIIAILDSPDLTWYTTNFNVWTTLEVHVGIMCACMATLKSILRRILPCLHSGSNSASYPRSWAKTPSQLRGTNTGYDLRNYRGGQHGSRQVTVVGGAARSDSDAESQERIIEGGVKHGQEGVCVTRTVDVS